MTKTRNIADLLDANGDVVAGALDNVPAVDLTNLSASNLTSGTVPDARFPATLPSVSGANLTNLPGGGKVLQVVYGTSSTQFSVATPSDNTYEFPSSNKISAVITPSASNSKIFVQYNSNLGMDNVTGDMGIGLGLKETISGSSATVIGGVAYGEGFYVSQDISSDASIRINQFILRSPSTTNQITYEVGFAGYGITVGKLNVSGTEGRIILMEIAG
tara:strand:- start:166 stop:816 length:651 start_codon:yes stop_codon:yes gene_type:complete